MINYTQSMIRQPNTPNGVLQGAYCLHAAHPRINADCRALSRWTTVRKSRIHALTASAGIAANRVFC